MLKTIKALMLIFGLCLVAGTAQAEICMFKVSGLRYYKQPPGKMNKEIRDLIPAIQKVSIKRKRDYISLQVSADVCDAAQRVLTKLGYKTPILIFSSFSEEERSGSSEKLEVIQTK